MKLGFIGTGNMAGAIMGGIIKNGVLKPEEIIGSDILEAGREKVHFFTESVWDKMTMGGAEKADRSLILSVKPQHYEQTIAEMSRAGR